MHFLQGNKIMHELQPHKLQLVVTGFKVISLKISPEEKYVGKIVEADALDNRTINLNNIKKCK